jgi:hypothetical protein
VSAATTGVPAGRREQVMAQQTFSGIQDLSCGNRYPEPHIHLTWDLENVHLHPVKTKGESSSRVRDSIADSDVETRD